MPATLTRRYSVGGRRVVIYNTCLQVSLWVALAHLVIRSERRARNFFKPQGHLATKVWSRVWSYSTRGKISFEGRATRPFFNMELLFSCCIFQLLTGQVSRKRWLWISLWYHLLRIFHVIKIRRERWMDEVLSYRWRCHYFHDNFRVSHLFLCFGFSYVSIPRYGCK